MEKEVKTSEENEESINNKIQSASSASSSTPSSAEFEQKPQNHDSSSSSSSTNNSCDKMKGSQELGASPKFPEANKLPLPDSEQENSSSALDSLYFFEDEVFRIDKKGKIKFGLVLETPGSDDDDEYEEGLNKGELRVLWYPEGREVVHAERSIGLADRTLMPGDVVRRLVPGKNTQRGYCRDINMKADVKVLGTKHIIKNVNAERLRVISNWERDSAVCLDSWVGSTKDVEAKAVLRTASGCRIEISSNDFYGFRDLNSRCQREIFDPQVFYPGNTVIGSLPSFENIKILTPGIPLHTNKKGKPLTRKFFIENVYTDSVWVHWQCKALSDDTNLQKVGLQPASCVTGEDLKRLKRLNLFESCMLQINDRSYLTFSSCDVITKKSEWDEEMAVKFKLIQQQQKEDNKNIFVENAPLTAGVVGGGGGGIGGVNSNSTQQHIHSHHHHFDKFKKKLNLSLDDKSSKVKRNAYKSNKDKSQTTPLEPAQSCVTIQSSKKTNSKEERPADVDDGWISTDGEDDMENEVAEEVEEQVNPMEQSHNQSFKHNDLTTTTLDECCAISTTTTISTCSSPSPSSRASPKLCVNKRQLKKAKGHKNLKKANSLSSNNSEGSNTANTIPKEGDELVVEALLVTSTATVVWQDGITEFDIPSTQLYPIYHLDNHEFFPGDFVISGQEDSDVNYRDYGVIQTVDHHGRTAHVKWFTTYTSADEPKPSYKGESEVSVYDLKDHSDFQYRPGTMVIRVANFVGEDAKCTAGQIIDNYNDGRVKVWWVDGHISMCWPQDIFEVGQYDHADWGGGGPDSEDSWETESENSEFGSNLSMKLSMSESHILSNIEKARVSISSLEEIFNLSPNLQNAEVMRKLLAVYKGCRYLDRLLNTNFFHEDNFMGLIERVRVDGNQSIVDRVQDQKNRLFSDSTATTTNTATSPSQTKHQHQQQYQYSAIYTVNSRGIKPDVNTQGQSCLSSSKEYAPKVLFNISSTPFKSYSALQHSAGSPQSAISTSACLALKRKCSPVAMGRENQSKKIDDNSISNLQMETANEIVNDSDKKSMENTPNNAEECTNSNLKHSISIHVVQMSPTKAVEYNKEKHLLLNSVLSNIERAYEKTSQLKSALDSSQQNVRIVNNSSGNNSASQDDSGNYSRHENCDGSSTSYNSSTDLTNIETNAATTPLSQKQTTEHADEEQQSQQQNNSSIGGSSVALGEDAAPEMICVRLCSLLKEQLAKCIDKIREKYFKDDCINLSTVFDTDLVEEMTIETIDEDGEKKQQKSLVTELGDDSDHKNEEDFNENLNETPALVSSPKQSSELAVTLQTHEGSPTKSSSPPPYSTPSKIEAGLHISNSNPDCFQLLSNAPKTHKFHLTIFHPTNTQQYYKAVQREHRMLKSSLPPGVWVRAFEDRMDLLSVMIEGPKKTPYEDGMFFFDFQLGREYPKSPPLCHYISYCSDRLNPNLYEEGKVCVSLLGTWAGRDSEMWGSNSTLLQVIVSIQGLILVPEPYYNEAGYEKQKETQQGRENSRMYNEMVIIKMVQATTKLIQNPPEIFRNEILQHYKANGFQMYERIKGWMELSKQAKEEAPTVSTIQQYYTPDFPLIPASRGFCLTLAGLLDNFKQKMSNLDNKTVPCTSSSSSSSSTATSNPTAIATSAASK